MPTYTEENFEDHIEQHLNQSDYRSLQSADYDKSLCLVPNETLQFIHDTQPQVYQRLERQYGADTPTKLLDRVSKQIASRGVLDVLRKGVKDRGCDFKLTYFRPSSGMNPVHQNALRAEPILPHSTTPLLTVEREIVGYDPIPQRITAGDDGTQEQSHRSGGDGCGKAVSDDSGSEGTSVPIQAVFGTLCVRQREGLDDDPLAERQDAVLSLQQRY